MRNLIIKLPKPPERTIANGIRIKCRTGEEYRNIVKGQQVYEIPEISEPVKAYVDTETELEVSENDE